jgi:uncharacterized protein YndB with AHSA1/START domain
MPVNTIEVQRPPEQVFAVLADPGTYEDWVVGAADIRDADPDWPATGSTFHHTQGVPFVGIKDSTSVRAVEPPRRLVLVVRVRPLLVAEVTLDLSGDDGVTTVTMTERPLEGWIARIYNRWLDRLVEVRNAVSLRRLKRIAESG